MGSVSSAVDSESPLQATAITKASPATMPINNFGVNFNCLLVMIFFCYANYWLFTSIALSSLIVLRLMVLKQIPFERLDMTLKVRLNPHQGWPVHH